MASAGDADFLNLGEEKSAIPPVQPPPSYSEVENTHGASDSHQDGKRWPQTDYGRFKEKYYETENPDNGNGMQAPNYSSTPNQDTFGMAPVTSGDNYNVAGGYATGPYSNPYGPGPSYPAGYVPPVPGNTNTTVVVTQPVGMVAPITTVPVKDYLVASILSTIFCCLCFGIAAILASTRSRTAMAKGNVALARAESEKARSYIIAAVVVGAFLITINILLRIFVLQN